VILDYFGIIWNGLKYGFLPSHLEWGDDPYSIVNRLYAHESTVIRTLKESTNRSGEGGGFACTYCNQINKDLAQIIYHLTDEHEMKYHQIASYLEEIGV
jgi:hypothetical protein